MFAILMNLKFQLFNDAEGFFAFYGPISYKCLYLIILAIKHFTDCEKF